MALHAQRQAYLRLFYKSVIESVAVFCIIVWYKGASLIDKKHLNTIRKQAVKITGFNLGTFDSIIIQD